MLRTQRETVWKNAPEELSCTDLVVFNSFLMHADASGETFVRARTVARETRRSERSVRRSIARLRTAGVLAVVTERTTTGRANIYRLLLGGQAANDTATRRRAPSHEDVREDLVQASAAVTSDREDCDPAVSQAGERASDNAPAAPPPFGAPGSGQIGSTHAATVAAPPPPTPSSDRSQVNDPPLSPPPGGESRVGSKVQTRQEGTRPPRVDFDTVQRVLAYFLARLWPDAVGVPVSRKRRRYVEARLRELVAGPHPELAEQTLRDAVDGAKLHPWHREADTGFHADRVFRDADTVEQLAKLGRARRLQDARLAAGRGEPAPSTAARPRAVCAPPALSREQMAADLRRIFGTGWAKGA